MFSAMSKTLDEMELQTFVSIIMGADISKFDEFVTKWYSTGGQTLTDQVNDWADSREN